MTKRAYLDLVGKPSLTATGTNNLVVGTSGAADLVFITNGVERLRIDSNGATTLTAAVDFTLANNDYLLSKNAAGSGNLSLLKADASDNTVLHAATGKTHRFETNAVLQWSISSGNLTQETGGGDIIMTSATKGLKIGASTLTADVSAIIGAGSPIYAQGAPASFHHIGLLANAATANGSIVSFLKSRKTDGTADTIVQDGDSLGELRFYGADGAAFQPAASIVAKVDGTPGTTDMPGRLEFSTVADGAATLLRRWYIGQSGNINQDATNGGSLVFNKAFAIRAGTADGADTLGLDLSGGGGVGDVTRGAFLYLRGDDHASEAGAVYISGSNASTTGIVTVQTRGANNYIAFRQNSAEQLYFKPNVIFEVKNSGKETTGAGSAALGANSPALTTAAPYTWFKVTTSDGSAGYIPVWK